jgi:hypothetical protein
VVPRSRQPRQQAAEPRRCQVAEKMRGPPSGRAQEGGRGEDGPSTGPADLDHIRGKRARFTSRGDWKFYLKQSLPRRGLSFGDLS